MYASQEKLEMPNYKTIKSTNIKLNIVGPFLSKKSAFFICIIMSHTFTLLLLNKKSMPSLRTKALIKYLSNYWGKGNVEQKNITYRLQLYLLLYNYRESLELQWVPRRSWPKFVTCLI